MGKRLLTYKRTVIFHSFIEYRRFDHILVIIRTDSIWIQSRIESVLMMTKILSKRRFNKAMEMLFGVTVLLYFIKILGGSRNYWPNLRATDPSLLTCFRLIGELFGLPDGFSIHAEKVSCGVN